MDKSLETMKGLMTNFEECQIQHIPREDNTIADALSRLASIEFEEYTRTVFLETIENPIIEVALVAQMITS